MAKPMQHNSARISAAEIPSFARQGIERALAARSTVVELTFEELEQVSGGALAQDKHVLSGAKPKFPNQQ